MQHVYLRDLATTTTTLVSRSWNGAPLDNSSFVPQISADGRYISCHTAASNLLAGDTNGVLDVVVHDRVTGATAQVSVSASQAQPNGVSYWGYVSADGRAVAFVSRATNLVPGDTNGFDDVFVAPNPLW
jgi:Tol biopolymer transport system component